MVNYLLKGIEWEVYEYKWQEDKKEDVSSYWMIVRERELTTNLKRKH